MEDKNLESAIEAILFATGEKISLNTMAEALEIDDLECKQLIEKLENKYKNENRGLQIIKIEESYQMASADAYYSYIEKIFIISESKVLGQSLLETLSIIAFKEPVSKQEIESIRGVDANYALQKLLERKLIKELGREDSVGRAILYGITDDFLRYFGFKSKDDLGKVDLFSKMQEKNINL